MLRAIAFVGIGIAVLATSMQFVGIAGAQSARSENILLGRPTDDSVTVHALVEAGTTVFVEYGDQPGNYSSRSNSVTANADDIAEITVSNLQADSRYFYRIGYGDPSASDYRAGQEHSFHTQRARGSTFTFGVQGDSHPERAAGMSRTGRSMYHPDLYVRTMELVASARPDLYFMLGDDFNISGRVANFFQGDKSALTQQIVDDVYLDQRRFLGIMANSTALFSVIGNHEEARRNLLGTKLHDVPIYAGRARIRMLPSPAPDDFYSGNGEPVDGIGLLRDYYAFTWGDALFVAINPYWHSPVAVNPAGQGANGMGTLATPPWNELEEEWLELTLPAEDRWEATMGDAQYHWLAQTLEESDSRFKFVFAHHVLGTGRGGVERATLYEWGGHNEEGEWEFDERRPDWELPVHQLMVEHGVSIFFQAHDHVFAHQELDGIVYQTVANPADETYTARNASAYLTGTVLENSGYLNVTVSPDETRVDYVRSYFAQDENDDRRHGSVDFSYTIN